MVLHLRYQTGQCSSLLDESEDKWDGDDLRGCCLDPRMRDRAAGGYTCRAGGGGRGKGGARIMMMEF